MTRVQLCVWIYVCVQQYSKVTYRYVIVSIFTFRTTNVSERDVLDFKKRRHVTHRDRKVSAL